MKDQNGNNNNNQYRNIIEELMYFAKAVENICIAVEENRENIVKALQSIGAYATWFSAIKKLADNQIVFTDDLTLSLAKKVDESENIINVMEEYYFGENETRMNDLISRCTDSDFLIAYKTPFDQVVEAYKRKHYYLACIGLFAILDGIISDVSGDVKSTSFKLPIIRNMCPMWNTATDKHRGAMFPPWVKA